MLRAVIFDFDGVITDSEILHLRAFNEILKQYGTEIIIGENTYNEAQDKIIARQLDLLRVKGKTEPVKVYELMGTIEKGIPDNKMRVTELFNQGFAAYMQQEWQGALDHFENAIAINAKDGPSRRYIQRCKLYLENPPDATWDGVFVMKSK